VFLSKTAVSQLNSLEKKLKDRVKNALKNLENSLFLSRSGADIKKLVYKSDPPLYRLRIGDYRVIFFVVDQQVKVTEIFPRKKGYKWLN
jgi:mRNA-degrading endonuclease RelE of RelBE toxin-antitoxin system